ncbi:uncharacterized protein LOC133840721 isoform X1 [Drosophila sulfurigaster albostrigata]|uniref:uncharacterized protein LOC133840721 isoform X1 n=1 Tax=Drosophila sulfurigaster albostrigata TaxID=89887 RepID=UPI002D21A3F1|nr:uncharacterized protein LOC133840721 isoform X1 [Drosophila sulfurigaster albostrigata]
MVKKKRTQVIVANTDGKHVVDSSAMSFVSEAEWLAREQRHQQRIQDVRICAGFIIESIEDYQDLVKLQRKQEHWNRYANCDGLPRAHNPPELRSFIAEIRHTEWRDEMSVVNWALSVNERSVLTQDIDAPDLTRKVLEQQLRPNIGKLYDVAVQRILATWERIEQLLDCEFELEHIPADRALEITQISGELSREIDLLFDKLTYRIMCSPDSYKTSFDGIMESYCYQSVNYNFQLWWLRDVPLRLDYLEIPLMVAKLDCVGVSVQIPKSVLSENLTLRCVHTFFDPYSEFAKSFINVIDKSTNELNAGMTDIEDCLINEWLMQSSIMNQMITSMEQKSILYEETMRELEAKVAHAKGDPDVLKKLKAPKEPQTLPEGKFPDPYKMFLEQEQQEFEEFLEQYLSPVHLNLKPDEINLRRYNILGGIFAMSFVHKPKHTEFATFNRTFHDDQRLLYTLKDMQALLDGNDSDDNDQASRATLAFRVSARSQKSASINRSRMQFAQSTNSPSKMHLHLEGDDIDYFFVSIQLPKQLCRYGAPLACQYLDEMVDEDLPEVQIVEESEEPRTKKKKGRKTARKRSDIMGITADLSAFQKISSRKSKKKQDDDDMQNEFARPRVSSIMPKTSMPDNLYRPSKRSTLHLTALRSSVLPEVMLRNFPLVEKPLNSMQVNALTKHCLPRILSSFKFPLEFKQDKMIEFAERSKGNKILRRANLAIERMGEDVANEPEYLSYEKQQGPERLYPIFDWREKVLYEQGSTTGSSASEVSVKVVKIDQMTDAFEASTDPTKQSLYSVIQTLENIQHEYAARPMRLMDQNIVTGRQRRPDISTIITGKPKSTVRISTLGSKLYHIGGRGSRSRVSTYDTVSFDSQGSQSSGSLLSPSGYRHGKSFNMRDEEERPKVNVKHWTTKHIVDMQFNPETCVATIKTDRLGLFGFAYKRYAHFPFRDWKLQQSEEQPNEIVFTLDTFHVRIFLFITNIGIRGYVTEITNQYTANPVKYLEIKEPISDYRELRKRFVEKNINIFAKHDASFYIDNGYFSEKHLSTELHIYDAFAVHCKLIKFYRSDWNRLATRRNIVLCLRNPKDVNDSADVTVRVTPDNSTFVEVSEPCSLDLEEVKLDYQLTWRNIGNYSDLHQLINSMYPQATDLRNRDPKLIYYIRTLFTEVRPLSFS